MIQLMLLLLLSAEIAAIKYVWLEYGLVAAGLFFMFGVGLLSFGFAMLSSIVAAIFEFDENQVDYEPKKSVCLTKSIIQFFKSAVFSFLALWCFNILFLAFVVEMNPKGTPFMVIGLIQPLFILGYSFVRSRVLYKLMRHNPVSIPGENLEAA